MGLSDHTMGLGVAVASVALGATVIEKHFTDDTSRLGPDHKFSMSPREWNDMVVNARRLEASLGDGEKRVERNEVETVIVQRRAMRAKRDISAGEVVREDLFAPLRPCPGGSVSPADFSQFLGRLVSRPIAEGHSLKFGDVE